MAVPTDEWNTPQKTILGTGPVATARPAGAISDSGRRPVPAEVAAAVPLAIISPPSEPTHIRRRNRRGLTLALVAVVVVAAIATAAVLLGGGHGSRAAATTPAPAER